MMALSYGQILAPRKTEYEKAWKQTMEYHDFVLANVKKALLFLAPTGLIAWETTLFLKGHAREIAMFFETATWSLAIGISLYSLMTYVSENSKLQKTDVKTYQANTKNLWKWIIPSTMVILLLNTFKTYALLQLVMKKS